MIKNVKCNGETVTQIVDGSGNKLADLTAEVENESSYVLPTSTNAGGELAAGSTIAAGTYFSGEATVPSGGGLAEGQVALHDIPNGKILSAQTVLSATTLDKDVTATIILPDSLSGTLPDYIIMVSDKHDKSGSIQSFKYGAKLSDVYNKGYGGLWYSSNSHSWNALTSSSAAPTASVDGTTLTMGAGTDSNYKWPAGTLTFYAIYTSDDA